MRILKKNTPYGEEGFVHLIPEDDEDIWTLYNLIEPGDEVKTETHRKVVKSNDIGVVNTKKMQIRITLKVISVDYCSGDSVELDIKGTNCKENEYIAIGAFHTFTIKHNQPLSITKSAWNSLHSELIEESSKIEKTADLAAFVMEEGVGHLCFIKNNSTVIKRKVERTIPKKRASTDSHEKALEKFYEECMGALTTIDLSVTKNLLIAGPGFTKDQFVDHMKAEVDKGNTFIKDLLKMVVLAHASNGYKNALMEALSDQKVLHLLKGTKIAKEIILIEKFFQLLNEDSDKVAYGLKYVIEADLHKAVQNLMITDKLYRSKNFAERKIYVDLSNLVKQNGGKVAIFSSLHATGEKLNSLSGIAAVLRFPLNLDYLDDIEESKQDESDEDNNE